MATEDMETAGPEIDFAMMALGMFNACLEIADERSEAEASGLPTDSIERRADQQISALTEISKTWGGDAARMPGLYVPDIDARVTAGEGEPGDIVRTILGLRADIARFGQECARDALELIAENVIQRSLAFGAVYRAD